ncbi:MAG: hypothetical protein QOE26_399 [Verrucomicrobiota bacterium]|jgi:hypothetical protein
MTARLLFIATACLLPIVCSASEQADVKSAIEQSKTIEGEFKVALDYRMKALNILAERLDRAMGMCTKDRKFPLTFDIVVFISASGTVERILYWPKSPFGGCVAREFKTLRFPPPKHPPYILPLGITKS